MVRTTRLALALVFMFTALTGAVAKSKKETPPSAPLPSEIAQAQTVFIAKGPGSDPYLKGGAELAFDTFYADVKNWGKYRIVGSPTEADLVFELSYSSQQVGTHVWSATNSYSGATQVYSSPEMDPRVSLNIYDRKTGFVLWSAAEARDTARRRKNREKNLVQAVHEMVSGLRARVENTPASSN